MSDNLFGLDARKSHTRAKQSLSEDETEPSHKQPPKKCLDVGLMDTRVSLQVKVVLFQGILEMEVVFH